jgi:2',3'-cyclic-nucleotide 2'-phosphodiesterase (5'-nucleotidase family)
LRHFAKGLRPYFVLIIILVFLNSVTILGAPAKFHLTILHTNDFHGADFSALAKEATLIKEIRTEEQDVLYLDAGDTFTRGPFHQKFFGELEFAVLNAVGCNALTLGNNEFKATEDLTAQKYLFDRINQAKFPILCANIRVAKDGSYLPEVLPFIVLDMDGEKVGIFGVSASRIADYPQTKGFIVDDPLKTAEKVFPEVAAESELVLALTHIGFNEDKKLAKRLPKLAAIIGGDSHTVLEKPFCQNRIPIVQAGDNGRFLGRLDLFFELEDGVLVLKEYKGELIPIDESVPEDPEIKALIRSFMEKVEQPAA